MCTVCLCFREATYQCTQWTNAWRSHRHVHLCHVHLTQTTELCLCPSGPTPQVTEPYTRSIVSRTCVDTTV
jgi:hypothetical protein